MKAPGGPSARPLPLTPDLHVIDRSDPTSEITAAGSEGPADPGAGDAVTAGQAREVLARYDPAVRALSLDEFYVDLTLAFNRERSPPPSPR